MAAMRSAPKVTGLQSGLAKGSALTTGLDGLTEKEGVDESHLAKLQKETDLGPKAKKRAKASTGKGWFNMPQPKMTEELTQVNIINHGSHLHLSFCPFELLL